MEYKSVLAIFLVIGVISGIAVWLFMDRLQPTDVPIEAPPAPQKTDDEPADPGRYVV